MSNSLDRSDRPPSYRRRVVRVLLDAEILYPTWPFVHSRPRQKGFLLGELDYDVWPDTP